MNQLKSRNDPGQIQRTLTPVTGRETKTIAEGGVLSLAGQATQPSEDGGSRPATTEVLCLEDLIQHQRALDDPARSSTSLSLAISSLRAAKLREEAMLRSISYKIEERAAAISLLCSRLELEISCILYCEDAEDAVRRDRLAELFSAAKQAGSERARD